MKTMMIKSEKNTNITDNSLDIMRILAAFFVMLLHYTGYCVNVFHIDSSLMQSIRVVTEHIPGVVIFFAISGFLTSRTCSRLSFKEFFFNRAVRILPPLYLCTIINACFIIVVAGVSFWNLLPWIIMQIFGVAFTPGFLSGFATGSINGALWTIFVQIQLYFLCAFVWKYLKKISNAKAALIFLASVALNIISKIIVLRFPIADKYLSRTFFPYFVWFYIGMVMYKNFSFVSEHARTISAISLLGWGSIVFTSISDFGYYTGIITSTLLSVIVIALSYSFGRFRVRFDFTYELFLYHWIVLNYFIHKELIQRLDPLLSLFGFLMVSGIISIIAHIVISRIIDFCSIKYQMAHEKKN